MTFAIWIAPLITFLGGLFGGIFGTYLSKRGEIRAIHKELTKVVEQNKAITAATEEIKARISTSVWTRQVRKETAFDALKSLARLDAAVSGVLSQHNLVYGEFTANQETRSAVLAEFKTAHESLSSTKILVDVACGSELGTAFDVFQAHSLGIIERAIAGDWDDMSARLTMSSQYAKTIGALVRQSVGIET
jgi:Zn-dependent metalloprotease